MSRFDLGSGAPVDLDTLVDTRLLVQERFWAKVQRGDGCWLWTATTNGRPGYGIFRGGSGRDKNGSRTWVLAHRYAYHALVGPVPAGMELDHICRTRLCVNPAHLRPLSHRDNTLAGESPTARQARRETCLRGHVFDKRDRAGKRRCSACDREKELRRYRRRHGRDPRPNVRTRRRLLEATP